MARKINPYVRKYEKQARDHRGTEAGCFAVDILRGFTRTYSRRLVQDAQDALARLGEEDR